MFRILSNGARFCSTFVIGLLYIRVIQSFGNETFAIIVISAACVTLYDCVREVVRTFAIPALGVACHSAEGEELGRTLVNSVLISSAFAAIAFGVSICVALNPQYLGIPEGYTTQSTAYLLIRFVPAAVGVAVCPLTCMFAVHGDFARYNAVFVAERFLDLFAALAVLVVGYFFDTSSQLIVFGVIISGTLLVLNCAAAWLAVRQLPARHLSPRLVSLKCVRELMSSTGWSIAYMVGLTLHIRFDVLLANAVFGLKTGVAYSVAAQLAGYVRTGVSTLGNGLDSVAARAWVNGDQMELRRQTRIFASAQVLAALAVTGALGLSLPDLLPVWLGSQASSEVLDFAEIASIARLLLIGMAARSASEALMSILSGCGRIRSHARPILLGSLVNPILIAMLYLMLPVDHRFLAPALSFAIIMPLVHVLLIPWIFSKTIAISLRDLIRFTTVPITVCVLSYVAALASASASSFLSGFPQLPCLFLVFLGTFFCFLNPHLLGLRSRNLASTSAVPLVD